MGFELAEGVSRFDFSCHMPPCCTKSRTQGFSHTLSVVLYPGIYPNYTYTSTRSSNHVNLANFQSPPRPSPSCYIGTSPKNPRYSTPLFWTLFQNLQSLKRQYDFRITLRIPTAISRSSNTSFPMVYPIFHLVNQLVMG